MSHSEAEARAERGRAARQEVERRVLSAIDRLDVMLQFSTANPACLSQGLHAVHVLQRGWMGRSNDELVTEAPDFSFDDTSAEELAGLLASMLAEARRAKHLVSEIE